MRREMTRCSTEGAQRLHHMKKDIRTNICCRLTNPLGIWRDLLLACWLLPRSTWSSPDLSYAGRFLDTPLLSLREKLVAPRLAASLALDHRSSPDILSTACLWAKSLALDLRFLRISMSQSEHVNTSSRVIVKIACHIIRRRRSWIRTSTDSSASTILTLLLM